MLWMSCLPAASLFLLLLPCFPAQSGGGNEQPTDVISAWEGGSANITCPMNSSQDRVGMHLTALGQNVIFVPKQGHPHINPQFVDRIKYSEEGENLRITLHGLQESDSEIYICSLSVKINDRHKDVYGKTTIVVVKAPSKGTLEQSPLYAEHEQGQSVNITCLMRNSSGEEKFHLLRTHAQPGIVLSVSNLNVSRVSPDFGNRVEFSREGNRTVITLHKLQGNDSDNYVCAEEAKESPLLLASGTILLVKEVDQACDKRSWGFYGLLIVVALLFCALVCCTLYRVDVKKYFQKEKPNVVYEDMTYSSRRNTLVKTATYSKGE